MWHQIVVLFTEQSILHAINKTSVHQHWHPFSFIDVVCYQSVNMYTIVYTFATVTKRHAILIAKRAVADPSEEGIITKPFLLFFLKQIISPNFSMFNVNFSVTVPEMCAHILRTTLHLIK